MKTYQYIAIAALALGFTACTQDEDFAQKGIVRIASANIATEVQTRVNTLDDGNAFDNEDEILLINESRTNKNSGTYQYTEASGWGCIEGMVLYTEGTNNFKAYYPPQLDSDYQYPEDQRILVRLKSADRMTATATGVAEDEPLSLTFEREHAKVQITPTFNEEFEGYKVEKGEIRNFWIDKIQPYWKEGSTYYTGILKPSESGFTVTLEIGIDTLTATTSTPIEKGKFYIFDLLVGKEVMKISGVSVTDWTQKEVDGGVAEEEISEEE